MRVKYLCFGICIYVACGDLRMVASSSVSIQRCGWILVTSTNKITTESMQERGEENEDGVIKINYPFR